VRIKHATGAAQRIAIRLPWQRHTILHAARKAEFD